MQCLLENYVNSDNTETNTYILLIIYFYIGSAHHSPPTGSLSNLVEVGTRGKV